MLGVVVAFRREVAKLIDLVGQQVLVVDPDRVGAQGLDLETPPAIGIEAECIGRILCHHEELPPGWPR